MIYHFQNTSITVGNTTVISQSVKDNPDLHFYTTIYGSLVGVIVVFTAIRAFVFMKVGQSLQFTVLVSNTTIISLSIKHNPWLSRIHGWYPWLSGIHGSLVSMALWYPWLSGRCYSGFHGNQSICIHEGNV